MSETGSGWRLSLLEVGVAVLVLVLLAAYLLPAIEESRASARRSQSRSNLKQVGVAFHNYHEAFNCFPPGGTFAADGTPHHSWTLFIQPYMAASPFYNLIDKNHPWDDPVNRDRFRTGHSYLDDPSLPPSRTAAGFPAVHYAPNQRLFHRNSSSRLKDIPHPGQTLMVSDAYGDLPAFGDPINWRDATLPFRTSSRGFGHNAPERRDGTHVLFADGSVDFLANTADAERHRQLAGAGVPEPALDLTTQREVPYRIPASPGWTYFYQVRGHQRSLAHFSLSPDRTRLIVDLGNLKADESVWRQEIGEWRKSFQELTDGAPVEAVEISGDIDASELEPFIALPSIRTLDLRRARVRGDATDVLLRKTDLAILRSVDE